MRKLAIAMAICLWWGGCHGQNVEQLLNRDYQAVSSGSLVQDKNFYILTLLQQNEKLSTLISTDKRLAQLRDTKLTAIQQSLNGCDAKSACLVEAFLWSDAEIELVAERLDDLQMRHKELSALVFEHLRPSGYYIYIDSLKDTDLVANAWRQSAKGMNNAMEVYGKGMPPRYPAIDSVTYDVEDLYYSRSLFLWAAEVLEDSRQDKLFFAAPLDFANTLLYINLRDEAGRYEPMQSLENKAAYDFIPTIDWRQFRYSSILVLGNGSEIYGVNLTPMGKLNLKMAVKNYENGLAPIIIVSGGHVHPFRTPYCEAIEMKRELMGRYHIPEERIVIEPHARHTTTNLRNASRLIFTYHMPMDKPALVTTNRGHSEYVASKLFHDRCLEDLGYLPFTLGKRLSTSALEFTPNLLSLHKDPIDPLDP